MRERRFRLYARGKSAQTLIPASGPEPPASERSSNSDIGAACPRRRRLSGRGAAETDGKPIADRSILVRRQADEDATETGTMLRMVTLDMVPVRGRLPDRIAIGPRSAHRPGRAARINGCLGSCPGRGQGARPRSSPLGTRRCGSERYGHPVAVSPLCSSDSVEAGRSSRSSGRGARCWCGGRRKASVPARHAHRRGGRHRSRRRPAGPA